MSGEREGEFPRIIPMTRVFTGRLVTRGYVFDRSAGKYLEGCPHLHRRAHRAQSCAESLVRRYLAARKEAPNA